MQTTNNYYPCYTVINPWQKGEWVMRWPKSKQGLTSAIKYCKKHDLYFVRFSEDDNHVEVVWENKKNN